MAEPFIVYPVDVYQLRDTVRKRNSHPFADVCTEKLHRSVGGHSRKLIMHESGCLVVEVVSAPYSVIYPATSDRVIDGDLS
jgi:hypothetical protein